MKNQTVLEAGTMKVTDENDSELVLVKATLGCLFFSTSEDSGVVLGDLALTELYRAIGSFLQFGALPESTMLKRWDE